MPQILCHHKNVYNFYCTVADGFRFASGLTEKQLELFIQRSKGSDGLEKLPERIKRAKLHGTSALHKESLEEMILCNRAGINEVKLTLDECISEFFWIDPAIEQP